jgi:hypothetical protein
MTDMNQSKEEVLSRILEKKKAQNRQRNSATDQKMRAAILGGMAQDPDRMHASHEMEVYAEMAGLDYRAVPPQLTFMVAQGLIQRVHHGWYRLPRAEH